MKVYCRVVEEYVDKSYPCSETCVDARNEKRCPILIEDMKNAKENTKRTIP